MLYFGSFNPIHNAHLHIALEALQELDFEELWFVLSPQNPHKSPHSLLASSLRLEMLKLALEAYSTLKLCTIELNLPLPSYTFFTLRKLRSRWVQNEFAILMGSDTFLQLPNWHNHQEIQALHKIYIYNRAGSTISSPLANGCYFLKARPIDISATEIRQRIQANLPIETLVPKKVANYIRQHNLYKL